jgi:hypothetical protein
MKISSNGKDIIPFVVIFALRKGDQIHSTAPMIISQRDIPLFSKVPWRGLTIKASTRESVERRATVRAGAVICMKFRILIAIGQHRKIAKGNENSRNVEGKE